MKRILFVCTGNTCRSPMAEGILRHIAQQEGLAVEVRSAGVAAVDGAPMAAYAKDVLRRRGIEDETTAQSISESILGWADLIFTMTTTHKRSLVQMYPDAVDKTYTLKEYVRHHAPETLGQESEIEQKLKELEVKHALSQPLTEEEQAFLEEWGHWQPDHDIADPFGGTQEQYEATAQEIEAQLRSIARLLFHK